jgi:parallel beta-helix repeat protein
MSKMALRVIVVVAILIAALGQNLFANTKVAVGPSTCVPSLVHFSTIQSAVNAVPAGSVIQVCPGTYPEQVVISEPLTLSGVTDGTGNAAVITVPGNGLVQNATSSTEGPVAVQLLVANTVEVTVQNITIDGTGGGCPAGANRVFGMEFYFVGQPVDGFAGGKIANNVVRNELNTCGMLTDGIEADNSYVTITGNEVHDIEITPIGATLGQASITNNTTQNALNGIVVSGGSPTNIVSGNTISNLTPNYGYQQIGLWISGGVATVSNNTISSAVGYSVGIYLPGTANGTKVAGNIVSAMGYGVYLSESAGTTVQTNTIRNSANDAIVDVGSAGGNIIAKNIVSEAPFGIYELSIGSDTITPNSYYNVVVTIDPSPFSGPPTPAPL